MEQKNWKDAVPGDLLPARECYATTQRLVKFAGATGDFHPLHYDWGYAQSKGYATPMVHGQLSRAWMVMNLGSWIGDPSLIQKLSCRFVSSIFSTGMKSMLEAAEDKVTCTASGCVTGFEEEDGQRYMLCDLWVKKPDGTDVVTGKARIRIPEE